MKCWNKCLEALRAKTRPLSGNSGSKTSSQDPLVRVGAESGAEFVRLPICYSEKIGTDVHTYEIWFRFSEYHRLRLTWVTRSKMSGDPRGLSMGLFTVREYVLADP